VQPPLSPRKEGHGTTVFEDAEEGDEIIQSPLSNISNTKEENLSVMELPPPPLLLAEDAECPTDEVGIHCKVIE
jgi:hypothetical protein